MTRKVRYIVFSSRNNFAESSESFEKHRKISVFNALFISREISARKVLDKNCETQFLFLY